MCVQAAFGSRKSSLGGNYLSSNFKHISPLFPPLLLFFFFVARVSIVCSKCLSYVERKSAFCGEMKI